MTIITPLILDGILIARTKGSADVAPSSGTVYSPEMINALKQAPIDREAR